VNASKSIADIAEARDKDLSENAEYDAAKKHKECLK
jgi:transcription elongation GreA/GreB family factor